MQKFSRYYRAIGLQLKKIRVQEFKGWFWRHNICDKLIPNWNSGQGMKKHLRNLALQLTEKNKFFLLLNLSRITEILIHLIWSPKKGNTYIHFKSQNFAKILTSDITYWTNTLNQFLANIKWTSDMDLIPKHFTNKRSWCWTIRIANKSNVRNNDLSYHINCLCKKKPSVQ